MLGWPTARQWPLKENNRCPYFHYVTCKFDVGRPKGEIKLRLSGKLICGFAAQNLADFMYIFGKLLNKTARDISTR